MYPWYTVLGPRGVFYCAKHMFSRSGIVFYILRSIYVQQQQHQLLFVAPPPVARRPTYQKKAGAEGRKKTPAQGRIGV